MEVKIGKDGFYVKFKTRLFEGYRKINRHPEAENVNTAIQPQVKIPQEILLLAVLLIQRLSKEFSDTEFMITINCNKNGEFYIDIPKQTVSGASVEFKLEPHKYDDVYMEIHTHPSVGGHTHFSGVDDHDQTRPHLYGVMGKIEVTDHSKSQLDILNYVELNSDIAAKLDKLTKLARSRISKKRYDDLFGRYSSHRTVHPEEDSIDYLNRYYGLNYDDGGNVAMQEYFKKEDKK